jgi:serine/threonine protein kinase
MDSSRIGHYEIVAKLGEGGMGVVYKATDLTLDRYVAIKVLAAEMVANPEILERFRIEAIAQARLSHTNIATLHAFEQIGPTSLIVMEYLDGESFEQMVARRGPIPSEEAVPLFRQALLGIGYAHRNGVIHRDIKPSNIMVTRSGIVKVMDFGLAKVAGGQRLTRAGTRMGTIAYMSPEQIQSLPADIRSDIYSLGATLYELLTAHMPFEADSDFQIMNAHINTPPPLPTRHYPYIPSGIERATLEAMAKDPNQRFQTCEAFGVALEHPGAVAGASAPAETFPSAPPMMPQSPATIPPAVATPSVYAPPPAPTPPPAPAATPGGWLDQIKSQPQPSTQKVTTPQPAYQGPVPEIARTTPNPTAIPVPPPTPAPQAFQSSVYQTPPPPPIAPVPPAWAQNSQLQGPPQAYAQPVTKRRSPWLYVALGVVGCVVAIVAILVGIGVYSQWKNSHGGGSASTGSDTGTSTNTSTNVYSSTGGTTAPSAPNFTVSQVLTANAGAVWDVALSPDASTLVTGDNDNTLKLWDVSSGSVRSTLTRQTGQIFGVAFTPDGQQVASASYDHSVITWNAASGAPLMKFPGDFALWCVAYSPDGTIIAASGDGKVIDMWSIPSGKFLASIQAPAPQISEIRFSPDGRLLAEGGNDGAVYLWNVADQSQFAELASHKSAVHSVAFSPDGSHLATADATGVINLWNVSNASTTPYKSMSASDQKAINDMVFTQDGNYLLAASDDNGIGVWNATSGELSSTLTGHTDAVVGLALSHDGKTLASASKDGTIRLWQIPPQ